MGQTRAESQLNALLLGLWLCTIGTAADAGAMVEIEAECYLCDILFKAKLEAFTTNFGLFPKAITGAKFHCSKMTNVSQCYSACLRGSMYTYSSTLKSIFDAFYRDYCDSACYVAVLPWCYARTVGQYQQSLTCSGGKMREDLRICLVDELFNNQNCTGGCTPGRRKAMFLFMQLQLQCIIPYTTDNECYSWVQACTDSVYGDAGSDFTIVSDPDLRRNNSLICSYFGDSYSRCIRRGVDEIVELGESPYSSVYQQPCQRNQAAVDFLDEFSHAYLSQPFCNAPAVSLDDMCNAAPRTTKAPSTTTSTANTAASTSAASTAKPTPPANPATATPPTAAAPSSRQTTRLAETRNSSMGATTVTGPQQRNATARTLVGSAAEDSGESAASRLLLGCFSWNWSLLPLFSLAKVLRLISGA